MNRRRAVTLAGHTGDEGLLVEALTDADPVVRSSALRGLHRRQRLTEEQLASGAADPEPTVRRAAAQLAATYELALAVLLADPDERVVEMAAWAAGERVPIPESVLDRLCELARSHADALVREAAVAALGASEDERALPSILAALDDRPAIRRRVVIALTPFDGPEVDAAFARARTDRDWQVRALADEFGPDDGDPGEHLVD